MKNVCIVGAGAIGGFIGALARASCCAATLEAAAVGEHIGCAITQTPQDRHAG